jgi:hypothetical protein
MKLLMSACKKTLVTDNIASFPKLAQLEKGEVTRVNDHVKSKRNAKVGLYDKAGLGKNVNRAL